jgi:hypothetical protein
MASNASAAPPPSTSPANQGNATCQACDVTPAPAARALLFFAIDVSLRVAPLLLFPPWAELAADET